MSRPRTPDKAQRFWDRVNILGANECWEWKGSFKSGYGRFTFAYVEKSSHRVSYELTCGSIPYGMHVMHLCNNKRCCNPKHLAVGTPSENTLAAYRDGLALSGESHPKTKYSTETIRKIAADPRPQLAIAAQYGMSQSHVSRIKQRQSRRLELCREA